MAKVLLVEDDNNLREIYEARLQAEGYETVTASDGEQALAVAKDAKPDLVISDVMMPKISGFEMLDILRNTDGLKDVKVIMLTALGQAEDKTRADQLGANKYLVKSQVTLEDIVKTAHQLLDDEDTTPAPVGTTSADAESSSPAATDEPAVPAEPAATPTEPATDVSEPSAAPSEPAEPASDDVVVADATASAATADAAAEPAAEEQQAMQAQIDSFVNEAVATEPAAAATPLTVPTEEPVEAPVVSAPVEPTPAAVVSPATETVAPTVVAPATPEASHDQVMADAVDSLTEAVTPQSKPSDVTAVEVPPAPAAPETSVPAPNTPVAATGSNDGNDGVTIAHKKIIQPISGPEVKPDINALLAKETAAEEADKPIAPPPAASTVAPNPNDIDPNSVAL